MNGKKRLGWLALALCTLGTLALTALPGEPAAVPAMKLEPAALLVRPGELFLDGVRIPELRTSPDGSRTYAPAAEVLAALDPDFWAGEELEYQALSSEGRDWLWLEDFCRRHGIASYTEGPPGPIWCTSAAGDWSPPEGYRAPILMYHGVGDDTWTTPELFVRTQELEEQLRWLLEEGWTPVWFSNLKHADQIPKPVLLCFDDGWSDNYTQLFPLLQKYRVKATLLIVAGTVGWSERVLSWEQLREMQDSGLVELQCHSLYHSDLDSLDRAQQEEELCWSKLELMRHLGRIPYVIAYPRGRENADTLAICREEYRFGLKMGGPVYVTGADPLTICRIGIPRGLSLEEFAARLEA